MSFFFPAKENKVKAFLFSQINLHFFLKSKSCSVRETSVKFTCDFHYFSWLFSYCFLVFIFINIGITSHDLHLEDD